MGQRQNLMQTAEVLFSQHGVRRITIEEICRAAGTSKMTFYRHFRNKADLVQRLHDDLMARGFAKYDEINAQDIPFEAKIALMGQWKQEFMSRLNSGFYRELISVDQSLAEYKRRYLDNIRTAQRDGNIRADIDPEFLWHVLEKTGELFSDGSVPDRHKDLGDMQRQLRTILWYGLLLREEPAK